MENTRIRILKEQNIDQKQQKIIPKFSERKLFYVKKCCMVFDIRSDPVQNCLDPQHYLESPLVHVLGDLVLDLVLDPGGLLLQGEEAHVLVGEPFIRGVYYQNN